MCQIFQNSLPGLLKNYIKRFNIKFNEKQFLIYNLKLQKIFKRKRRRIFQLIFKKIVNFNSE